jgi:hypothetical protein
MSRRGRASQHSWMTHRSLLLEVRLHAKPDDAPVLIIRDAPFEIVFNLILIRPLSIYILQRWSLFIRLSDGRFKFQKGEPWN